MKSNLLLMAMLLSSLTAMAATVQIDGAAACRQDETYHYEATAEPDKSDKKRGALEARHYDWSFIGSAWSSINAPESSYRAEVKTVAVPVFPANSLSWPKGDVCCTVRFKWKKNGVETQTEKTSDGLKVDVIPESTIKK